MSSRCSFGDTASCALLLWPRKSNFIHFLSCRCHRRSGDIARGTVTIPLLFVGLRNPSLSLMLSNCYPEHSACKPQLPCHMRIPRPLRPWCTSWRENRSLDIQGESCWTGDVKKKWRWRAVVVRIERSDDYGVGALLLRWWMMTSLLLLLRVGIDEECRFVGALLWYIIIIMRSVVFCCSLWQFVGAYHLNSDHVLRRSDLGLLSCLGASAKPAISS